MRIGSFQKKILILLLGYLASGLAYTPGQRRKVLQQIDKELAKVDDSALTKAINNLYRNKLVDIKKTDNGKVKIILSENGKEKALEYQLEKMKIKKPQKWDGKWRAVLFDIPHEKTKVRDAIRFHLKRLGFYQYQKSVFIYPYPCAEEIDFLVEFYGIRPQVRQLEISKMDNDFHLRQIFKDLI